MSRIVRQEQPRRGGGQPGIGRPQARALRQRCGGQQMNVDISEPTTHQPVSVNEMQRFRLAR
jgi:hypothetical protein